VDLGLFAVDLLRADEAIWFSKMLIAMFGVSLKNRGERLGAHA
jgi:hypothetical protein